jgi:hypothetical protein
VDGTDQVTCAPASGSTFPIGNTTVTCTAKDAHGNAAVPTGFVVHVIDTTPPVLTLPAPSVAATSLLGAVVTYVASAVDLVDGARPVTCAPASINRNRNDGRHLQRAHSRQHGHPILRRHSHPSIWVRRRSNLPPPAGKFNPGSAVP